MRFGANDFNPFTSITTTSKLNVKTTSCFVKCVSPSAESPSNFAKDPWDLNLLKTLLRFDSRLINLICDTCDYNV